ncbi:MAG: hypothetical protein IH904_00185 [Proteobacteria bacterium]|nr:hypothetical protein [Pseudomonadota bacterium]
MNTLVQRLAEMRRLAVRLVACLSLLLALGACEGLAALGGAGVSLLGGDFLDAEAVQNEARARWRTGRDEWGVLRKMMVVAEAQRLVADDKFDEAMTLIDRMADRHDAQFPDLLVVEHYRAIAKLVDERRKARRDREASAPGEAVPAPVKVE